VTVMVDQIVGPDQVFHAGTRVAVKLVAALHGEGAGQDPARMRTIHGVVSEKLNSELVALDLEPNDAITTPAGTYYQIETGITGTTPARRTFTAPAEATPTTSTSDYTVGGPNLAASTSGFPSSGMLWFGRMLLAYTGKTPTAFTGVTGGTTGVTVPAGAEVRQAVWIGSQITVPPADLPTLTAGRIPFVPTGGIDATDVQGALAQLDELKATDAAVPHRDAGTTETIDRPWVQRSDFFLLNQSTRFDVMGAAGATLNDKLVSALGAAAAVSTALGGADVYLHDGDYPVSPNSLPHNVNVIGAGRNRVRLLNQGTAGASFFRHYGSRCAVAGLTIDGNRAAQTVPTGASALQFVKPTGSSGGGTPLSGGLLLTTGVLAGATALPVAAATFAGLNGRTVPVMAGDLVTITDDALGSNWEVARVARSYAGGLSIPLDAPLVFARTTGAQVSVASTAVLLEDVDVYGVGFIGASLWHTFDSRVCNVRVFDCIDTGMDAEGGTRAVVFTDCLVEGWQRFAFGVDANVLAYGLPGDMSFRDCRARILNGGADPNGVAFDGWYIGVCEDVAVRGGSVDLRRAGNTGIRRDAQGAQRFSVDGLAVVGPDAIRAGTYGFVSFNQDHAHPTDARVKGMKIRSVTVGIDFQTDRTGLATDNLIEHVANFGINMTGNDTNTQRLTTANNVIDGCVVGVRADGAAQAGSTLYSRGDDVRNASFAPIYAGTGSGWTLDT
jgi:hypothetical protein